MGKRSKEAMVISINNLVAQMKGLYDEAGIKKDCLSIPRKYINLPYNIIKKGFDWVTTIFYSEFDAIKQVKRLLPDELWVRYKNWGMMDDTNIAEVKLLKQRLKAFHKVVTSISRPDIFKRTKINGYYRKVKRTK